MRFALPCLLLASCAHLPGAGGGFPDLLTRPLPGRIEANKTWSWPAPTDFREQWEQQQATRRTHSVLSGELLAFEHRWYDEKTSGIASVPAPDFAVLEGMSRDPEHGCRLTLTALDASRGGKRYLQPLLEGGEWCATAHWEVVKAEPKALYLRTEDAVAVLRAPTASAQLPVPDDYLADWTYAATLLTPHGDSARLLAEYESSAPMGRCSMDRRPADYARSFAQRCFAQGELACFLQVHLRVVGDQFNRVAWSSMGEAQSPTDASTLEKTGMDVDRFFRGLVVLLPDERPSELGSSRLARALIESGRRERFEPLLVRMIEDDALDTYNRFRALTVYTSLHYRGKGDDAAMKAKVAKLKLDPLAQAWWASLKK